MSKDLKSHHSLSRCRRINPIILQRTLKSNLKIQRMKILHATIHRDQILTGYPDQGLQMPMYITKNGEEISMANQASLLKVMENL